MKLSRSLVGLWLFVPMLGVLGHDPTDSLMEGGVYSYFIKQIFNSRTT
jgi:hypothetical protein